MIHKTNMGKIIKTQVKEATEAVTGRFLLAMDRIVSKAPGSKVRTVKQFAETIKVNYSYMSKINTERSHLNATVAMCVQLCIVHHVNGHWLLTGEGEMFGGVDILERIEKLERSVDALSIGKKSGKKLPKKA